MKNYIQWLWYWMPVEGKPHYMKNVTLCLYDAKEGNIYQNIGVCIMDDFGELVKCSFNEPVVVLKEHFGVEE